MAVFENTSSITIELLLTTTIHEAFDEVQQWKEIIPDVNLKFNNAVLPAYIYETKEQLANTLYALIRGDKLTIATNLPLSCDPLDIGCALECISEQLKARGFDGYTRAEIEGIEQRYAAMQTSMKKIG